MGQDDITLVSTTDSAEEVQAALTGTPVTLPTENDPAKRFAPTPAPAAAAAPVETPATPATETPATPETPAAAAKPAEEVPPANETPEQKADREHLSARERRQKKINDEIAVLTAKKHEARRDADAEEARLAELRRQRAIELAGGTPPKPTPAATPSGDPDIAADIAVLETRAALPKPKLDDVDAAGDRKFENYEQWVESTNEWYQAQSDLKIAKSEQKLLQADRVRTERDTATRAHQTVLASHNERLEAFKTRTPDFDAVLASAKADVQEIVDDIGPHAFNAIDRYTVEDAGELGPAIIHHLASHPAEMRRIAELPVPMQLAALGKIEARLEAASSKPGPASVVPHNPAPDPITPVGSAPTASTVNPDTEPYQAYKARRNREERIARGLPV